MKGIKIDNGITLVALVITIIVLLILAGVAISAITGETTLFGKAKEATDKYNNASKNEAELIKELTEIEIVEHIADGEFSQSKGVNTPDTSKLPTETTKYIKWSGTAPFEEITSDSAPDNWYDYYDSKWANIKTTSKDKTLQAYWVWIPRFAYKLAESSATKTINVVYIKGTGTLGVNGEACYYSTDEKITKSGTGIYKDVTDFAKGVNGEQAWIVHPAFTFKGEQLSGIWVAKYESSNTNSKVEVKPNVASWRSISALNIFNTCRNIQTEGQALGTSVPITQSDSSVNTHLIKSIEWGAVAILSNSEYGYYDKVNKRNLQIWNNPNSSYITGSAGTTADAANVANASCSKYNDGNGPKASTTGNIYGIYDMAGGSWEYVAAVFKGYSGKLGSPESIYYDEYNHSSASDYISSKIGDLIGELKPTSNIAWNGDALYLVKSTHPVLGRGGTMVNGAVAGIFYSSYDGGDGIAIASFRPTLIVSNTGI